MRGGFYELVAHSNKLIVRMGWAMKWSCKLDFMGRYPSGEVMADVPIMTWLEARIVKLLLFSDLHCDVRAARRLVERATAVDVVVGAGDFATVRRGLEQTLDVLKAIDRPAVLVPGNSESDAELVAACQGWLQAHVLHGSGTTIGGVEFWGLGGGVPVTPFGAWSFDFTEEQAEQLLAGCPRGGVLVSHSPPKGAVDVSSNGASLGSAAVRRAAPPATSSRR